MVLIHPFARGQDRTGVQVVQVQSTAFVSHAAAVEVDVVPARIRLRRTWRFDTPRRETSRGIKAPVGSSSGELRTHSLGARFGCRLRRPSPRFGRRNRFALFRSRLSVERRLIIVHSFRR